MESPTLHRLRRVAYYAFSAFADKQDPVMLASMTDSFIDTVQSENLTDLPTAFHVLGTCLDAVDQVENRTPPLDPDF